MSLPANALVFCYDCRKAVPLRLGLWLETVVREDAEPDGAVPASWLLLSGLILKPGVTMRDVVADLQEYQARADARWGTTMAHARGVETVWRGFSART